MSDTTHIEWTDATWNPIAGCSLVSPGCTNCYAMRRVAPRLSANPATPHYAGTVQPSKAGHVWTGKIGVAADAVLLKPLSWKRPRRIFVNSTSDLFHEGVSDQVIDRVFAVMALCPQHTFQVLTKRPERMRAYLTRPAGDGKQNTLNHLAYEATSEVMNLWNPAWKQEGIDGPHRSRAIMAFNTWPLPNVWLGVSVEDQQRADERIPVLLDTPAAVRWISAEPLLGPIDLRDLTRTPHPLDRHLPPDLNGSFWVNALTGQLGVRSAKRGRYEYRTPAFDYPRLDWIVCGGESGQGARPMHPDWARALRDQCLRAGVPFLFKQWGNCLPCDMSGEGEHGEPAWLLEDAHFSGNSDKLGKGREVFAFGQYFIRFGSATHTGRTLDGVVHNAYPEAAAAHSTRHDGERDGVRGKDQRHV